MVLAALAAALAGNVGWPRRGPIACTRARVRPAGPRRSATGLRLAAAAAAGFDEHRSTNDCGSGHGIAARMSGEQPYGARGEWRFHPAPNRSISAFDLTWSGTAAARGEST
jgi:hypothetical protein